MLKIRDCKLSDFDQVFVLLEQLWADIKISKTKLRREFQIGLRSKKQVFLCAEMDGKILGFCSMSIQSLHWQSITAGHIHELVVDSECRGKKIGEKLLKKSITIAREKGCKKIELNSKLIRKRAHKFYLKHNFKKTHYYFVKKI